MITSNLQSKDLAAVGRLDAWYYLAPGAGAARRLDKAKAAGLKTVPIGGPDGLGSAWMPGRLKQVAAAPGEDSLPYIKPHDIFQYLPVAHARLSKRNSRKISDYAIEEGWILQTRSGRNLGLNALVDKDLASFTISDDLIRIQIADERLRFYATAFLRSKTGHGLLRRDKSGSVIDHLDPHQVEAIEIPILPEEILDTVSDLLRRSFLKQQSSRRVLREVLATYQARLPQIERATPQRSGWGVKSPALGRLDAASHDPFVSAVRRELLGMGGVRVDSVATPLKPPGRYKTIYVGPDYGMPFMSGTQILQYTFAKPQFMSPRAFRDVNNYILRPGWTVYMADGRSEQNLGVPAMITSARDGWIASGHVGRLVPKNDADAGWLWLAARTWHFGVQLKALASGSVVDSTFANDVASVILPPSLDIDGDSIVAAWEGFAEAQQLEAESIRLIDEALADVSGVADEELESEVVLADGASVGEDLEEAAENSP